mmetsp:Transcript_94640/g.294824  ORF Transcript_94640/g.294824 Transcript_94640/m.294824 type:complete len:221 (-) Transcript_94640:624-1286(-)
MAVQDPRAVRAGPRVRWGRGLCAQCDVHPVADASDDALELGRAVDEGGRRRLFRRGRGKRMQEGLPVVARGRHPAGDTLLRKPAAQDVAAVGEALEGHQHRVLRVDLRPGRVLLAQGEHRGHPARPQLGHDVALDVLEPPHQRRGRREGHIAFADDRVRCGVEVLKLKLPAHPCGVLQRGGASAGVAPTRYKRVPELLRRTLHPEEPLLARQGKGAVRTA